VRQWHSIASDAQWDATICIILWTIIYCDIYMRRTYPIRYMLTKRLPHWIFFSILHYEPHNYYSISDTTNANLRIKYTLIIICTKLQTQHKGETEKEHAPYIWWTRPICRFNMKLKGEHRFYLLTFVHVTIWGKHKPWLSSFCAGDSLGQTYALSFRDSSVFVQVKQGPLLFPFVQVIPSSKHRPWH
jgi:hypothetical protein